MLPTFDFLLHKKYNLPWLCDNVNIRFVLRLLILSIQRRQFCFQFHELTLDSGQWSDLAAFPHGNLAYCGVTKFTAGGKDMVMVAGGTKDVHNFPSFSRRVSTYDIAGKAWTSFDHLVAWGNILSNHCTWQWHVYSTNFWILHPLHPFFLCFFFSHFLFPSIPLISTHFLHGTIFRFTSCSWGWLNFSYTMLGLLGRSQGGPILII